MSAPIVIAQAGHQSLVQLQKVLKAESIRTEIVCPPGVDPGKG